MNLYQEISRISLCWISNHKILILQVSLLIFLLVFFVLPANSQSIQDLPGSSWWNQNWIYLLFAIIFLILIFGMRMYEISRITLKNEIELSKLESAKSKELDERKSQFFTDISHEFRTPLTLIMGRLELLMDENTDIGINSDYSQIHNNASRLLQLINQLLDLSRLESGSQAMQAGKGDIIEFIKGLSMSFASKAMQKNIELDITIDSDINEDSLNSTFYYDADIMEKIVNNLLSNAFKFTPDKGEITVKLGLIRQAESKVLLEIAIEDSGIGIPEDALSHVFDRFYKSDSPGFPLLEGSGIGLALVKELVRIHKGEIIVKSKEGEGSSFILKFPVGNDHFTAKEINSNFQNTDYSHDQVQAISYRKNSRNLLPSTSDTKVELEDDKRLVLIVEDHIEVRDYIVDCIREEYNIMQASSADEGFEKAEEFIPDLIISDVMMPGEDGFRFCEKLKASVKTSHIPVILLTAKADFSDKIGGLEVGADDYLTKPFQARELKLRIRNLIENRLALRKKYSSNTIIKPAEISVSSHDANFIGNLMNIVEKNIENQNFRVEDLSTEAHMSLSQLHRKLRAIINMSASQFIRSVRMHRAMELLNGGAGNISEIAYRVGYDDPGYFTKTFKIFFGKRPSEVKKIA